MSITTEKCPTTKLFKKYFSGGLIFGRKHYKKEYGSNSVIDLSCNTIDNSDDYKQ